MAQLLVVTGLVLEDGGDEDQAIAAMLHDSVEDGGGRPMLERIEEVFGPDVAAIVEGCSEDSVGGDPTQPAIERKRRYLRLWLDPDLHDGQAPEGWVQVRLRVQN